MMAILARVGIDKGTDGTLAPIFEDGSFEYIPPSTTLSSTETRTYANTIGRSGKPLSTYLPENVGRRKVDYYLEFETFSHCGRDFNRKRLSKLEKGDLLVFYAGLTPYENDKYEEALYIIGYFTIDKVIDFRKLSEDEIEELRKLYSNNTSMQGDHYAKLSMKELNRCYNLKFDDADIHEYHLEVLLVKGDRSKSRLLDKAILISRIKHGKKGRAYYALSYEMENQLGISGTIQKRVPVRLITDNKHINNLKKLIGLGE